MAPMSTMIHFRVARCGLGQFMGRFFVAGKNLPLLEFFDAIKPISI